MRGGGAAREHRAGEGDADAVDEIATGNRAMHAQLPISVARNR
jgi:hypothetical protein